MPRGLQWALIILVRCRPRRLTCRGRTAHGPHSVKPRFLPGCTNFKRRLHTYSPQIQNLGPQGGEREGAEISRIVAAVFSPRRASSVCVYHLDPKIASRRCRTPRDAEACLWKPKYLVHTLMNRLEQPLARPWSVWPGGQRRMAFTCLR